MDKILNGSEQAEFTVNRQSQTFNENFFDNPGWNIKNSSAEINRKLESSEEVKKEPYKIKNIKMDT